MSIVMLVALLQYLGMKYGVGPDGNPISERPEGIETDSDWVKPGGPRSREACIKFLISRGADVNEPDFHNFTCLHYAAMWGTLPSIFSHCFVLPSILPGWTSTVRILLDAGADINARNIAGKTALMFAVEFLHEALVSMLLICGGVDIDAVDTDGFTALMIAVSIGDDAFNIVKFLLDAGSNPDIYSLRKKNCLKIACHLQNLKLINLLLDYKCQRRKSAFNLLTEEALAKVQVRLDQDEQKEREELQRAEKELLARERENVFSGGKKNFKSPYGAWVEYREKKSGTPFYYNTVTRASTKERPKDFKVNKNRVIKEATFGMSFYH